MEIIKPGTKINFVGFRKIAVVISVAAIAFCLFSIFVTPKPNWGIDFAGGTEMTVEFTSVLGTEDIAKIRSSMESLNLGEVKVVESFGSAMEETKRYQIHVEGEKLEKGAKRDGGKTDSLVKNKLTEVFGAGSFEVLKSEYVGPAVGEELRNAGIMAIFGAMILILIYITLRFEFRYALGAVLAIFHDIILTTGAFVITDKDFNLPIIAALLTIIGYSLNDTIVVFDRIRENVRRLKRVEFAEMINVSINETLSRTLLTSATTFSVVFFLFLLGGGVIHDFAFALMVGVIVGTYSSIFVASTFVIWWENTRAQKRTTSPAESQIKG
jgi:preprotein translocase subunit SecF